MPVIWLAGISLVVVTALTVGVIVSMTQPYIDHHRKRPI
jgi:hypothetical protein